MPPIGVVARFIHEQQLAAEHQAGLRFDPGAGIYFPHKPPDYLHDRARSDLLNAPWRGPGQFDNYSGELPEMRRAYRELSLREPTLLAAIEGKVDAIASTDVSVIPANKSRPNDVKAAAFCQRAVEETRDGWDGLLRAVLHPAYLDGWSVIEPHFEGGYDPEIGPCIVPRYFRSLDTTWLRLQLDPFREIKGVVSLVAGQEVFAPSMFLIYTHRPLFHSPFGNSDVRSVYRDVNLIEDAYRMWYLALKQCGEPYVHGRYSNPNFKLELLDALEQLRASGQIVTPKEDEVALLNLSSAASFQAFESQVNKLREDIFLAVRGAYLPFLEGQGGENAHGNTAVHKGASDAKVDISGKSACRAIRQQLFTFLVGANFPAGTGVPSIQLGGIDWAETKSGIDAVSAARKEGARISAKWFHVNFKMPPPEDETDVLGGEAAPGGGQTPPTGQPTPPAAGGTPSAAGNEAPPAAAPLQDKPGAALPQPGGQPRPLALPPVPPKPTPPAALPPKPTASPAAPRAIPATTTATRPIPDDTSSAPTTPPHDVTGEAVKLLLGEFLGRPRTFAEHDVSGEARDAGGKWTKGGSRAGDDKPEGHEKPSHQAPVIAGGPGDWQTPDWVKQPGPKSTNRWVNRHTGRILYGATAPKGRSEEKRKADAEERAAMLQDAPTLSEQAKQVAAEWGREYHLDPAHLPALLGNQPGSVIFAHRFAGGDLNLTVSHPDVTNWSRKLITGPDGSLTLYNSSFFLRPSAQGSGWGTKAFAEQIKGAVAAGVSVVKTTAGRGMYEGQPMNGYYTWPRLGYDAPLTEGQRQKLPKNLKDARTIQDLYKSAEGRAWWKANGTTTSMTFDVSPGSRSMTVLNEYLRSKGQPEVEYTAEQHQANLALQAKRRGSAAEDAAAPIHREWEPRVRDVGFDVPTIRRAAEELIHSDPTRSLEMAYNVVVYHASVARLRDRLASDHGIAVAERYKKYAAGANIDPDELAREVMQTGSLDSGILYDKDGERAVKSAYSRAFDKLEGTHRG